ncbi:DUF742 domain-containing protein [Streptomyces sp. DSM 42041]|uniref:DUF742 domain-containing protein n=1 Tax=Streptomyces hazeniae TaxID=3075538 RepID=A0ABU2NX61_9ACTN|nr:DUF742 domain-containing protein [Streptomyces sp. DSM 42041]MDT0381579.1 DUF742 domain-containing protein [Streptomyces sp. DSM 42041]
MSRPRRRADLVRAYVITGGRARPTRNTHVLDVVTLVTATPDRTTAGLAPEQRAAVDMVRGGFLSVVELASHLGQPLTVTRVLLSDLLDTGHLVTRLPEARTPEHLSEVQILERVLAGLHAL